MLIKKRRKKVCGWWCVGGVRTRCVVSVCVVDVRRCVVDVRRCVVSVCVVDVRRCMVGGVCGVVLSCPALPSPGLPLHLINFFVLVW